MIRMRCFGFNPAYVTVTAVLFIWFSGCETLKSIQSGAGTTTEVTKKEKGPVPLYYDFGDVLLPSELKLDKKASFVFKTPGLSAGVLSLNGWADASSLIAFFENNMTNDNWKPVSSFKSPRTMMLYHKENRWCVINITEKEFKTYVEIWMAPTIEGAESGLLK